MGLELVEIVIEVEETFGIIVSDEAGSPATNRWSTPRVHPGVSPPNATARMPDSPCFP